jgi:hypothetical protein
VIRITPSNLSRWSELPHRIHRVDPNYPKFIFSELSMVDRAMIVKHITPPRFVSFVLIFSGPTVVMTSYQMVCLDHMLLDTRNEGDVGENSSLYFCWNDPNYTSGFDTMIHITPSGVIRVMWTMLSPFSRILFYITCFCWGSFSDK